MIDIIIINYNCSKHLQELIQSLTQKPEGQYTRRTAFAITVVDNHSRDGSAAMVESLFPNVQLISRPENDGYAAAVNEGIASTRNHEILLLNSDVYIKPIQAASLSRIWERHDMNAIIAPLHLEPDGFPQLTWGDFPTAQAEAKRKQLEEGLYERKSWARDRALAECCRTREVAWASGSCLYFGRDAAEKIGPWDQNFFLYFEDIDWCLRAKEHGIPVIHTAEVHVYHEHGASVDSDPEGSEIEYRRSQCYFTQKYFGKRRLFLLRLYLSVKMLGRWSIGSWSGFERATSWQILKDIWSSPGG